MAKQTIDIGLSANDKSGDPLRVAFNKVNQNFTELYTLTGNSSLTEIVQDYTAPLFTHSNHTGISFTYNDTSNEILAVVDESQLVHGNHSLYLGSNGVLTFSGTTIQGISDSNIVTMIYDSEGFTGNGIKQQVKDNSLNLLSSTNLTSQGYFVNSNSHTWAFGIDGTTNLPTVSNTINGVLGNNAIIQTPGNVAINANSSAYWLFKSSGDLVLPENGVIKNNDGTTYGQNPSIHSVTFQNTAGSSIILLTSQEIVLCNVNAANGDINLVFPTTGLLVGKTYTIKNINQGSHNLYVQSLGEQAMETDYGYVGTGAYATMNITGATITWIWDGTTWRIINKFGF